MTQHDPKLVDEGAVRIFLAMEYETLDFTDEQLRWGRKALGIGEDLEHCGDCTKVAITCVLCAREACQRYMQAALDAINAAGYCVPTVEARELWYRAAHNAQFVDKRDPPSLADLDQLTDDRASWYRRKP